MRPPCKAEAQAWIGLVHVRPRSDNDLLEGAAGAYVPAVALAPSGETFESMVATYLESRGFAVLAVEDVERFMDRLEGSGINDEIKSLVGRLTEGVPIALDTFQAYEMED